MDTDGDGYSDADENRYDWNTSLVDQRIRGGISNTESALIGVSLDGGGLVKVSSDPPGMINEYSKGVGAGKSHLSYDRSCNWKQKVFIMGKKWTDRADRAGCPITR